MCWAACSLSALPFVCFSCFVSRNDLAQNGALQHSNLSWLWVCMQPPGRRDMDCCYEEKLQQQHFSHILPFLQPPSPTPSLPSPLMASCLPCRLDRSDCCPAQSRKGRYDTAHSEHPSFKGGGRALANSWRGFLFFFYPAYCARLRLEPNQSQWVGGWRGRGGGGGLLLSWKLTWKMANKDGGGFPPANYNYVAR